jgi:AbrB family looped-hinge helix DNA binding protein
MASRECWPNAAGGAVELASEYPPELVLTDLDMPDMTAQVEKPSGCTRLRSIVALQVNPIDVLYSVNLPCNIETMRTTISKRGQVSVPAEIRKRLQIGPDTTLEWIIEGNTARVIPIPADPVKVFRGSGKKKLVKALLKERRRDRGREDRS